MIDFIDTFKKTAIALGIAILLPFLVSIGFDIFYPRPPWLQHQENLSSEENEKNQKEWRTKNDKYEQAYFYTSIIIGSMALALGTFLKLGFLGSGFIVGGVITTLSGLIFYWHRVNRIAQFLALLLIFIMLIGAAYLVGRTKHNKAQ
jgi:uncharacterized membrane protein YkgB